jgi:Protein of unknown function (DUF2934)
MSTTSPSNSNGSSSPKRTRGGWVVQSRPPILESLVMPPLEEEIARRAYEKFLARGGEHGLDRQDWDEASRELVAEMNA